MCQGLEVPALEENEGVRRGFLKVGTSRPRRSLGRQDPGARNAGDMGIGAQELGADRR